MSRVCCLLVLAFCLGGCGGHYILTVPDQVAPAGGTAMAVVRLERNDFFVLFLPVENAHMRMRIGGGQERVAYTDKRGYAATTVPAPDRPGRYTLTVEHTDPDVREISAAVGAYVWDVAYPVVAVDLDSLPRSGDEQTDARQALQRLAAGANLLYMTRQAVSKHRAAHAGLQKRGYPDGPVLRWERERWRIVRPEGARLPRIVVETRMISQLAALRKVFKNLQAGVCTGSPAAEGFVGAGLRCVVVGGRKVGAAQLTRRASWADLAAKGL